jgi:hypothetical protein
MPDVFGNPTISDVGYAAYNGAQTVLPQAQAGLLPFTTGNLGDSPLTRAAIEAFKINALPVIQHQFALQGLGQSPALGVAVGDALASAMPAFIQNDLANRLTASQALQQRGLTQQQLGGQFLGQGEQLGQNAAQLIANIGNQEAMRQLEASKVAGQLVLGYGLPMTQLEQSQVQNALGAFTGAGQLQRGVVQEQLESEYMDYLRQQGLAEQTTTGLFGGSMLPPTLQQQSRSVTDGK